MEEDDDPRAPLLPVEGRVYRRRWYILMIFGMINFLQNIVWNTWGPIAQSAEVVFEWTDSQIGQFANMGNIAYLITVFPVCYLIEKLGTHVLDLDFSSIFKVHFLCLDIFTVTVHRPTHIPRPICMQT